MTFYFHANKRLLNAIAKGEVLGGMEFVKRGSSGFETDVDDEDESGQEELRETLRSFGTAWQEDAKIKITSRSSKKRAY